MTDVAEVNGLSLDALFANLRYCRPHRAGKDDTVCVCVLGGEAVGVCMIFARYVFKLLLTGNDLQTKYAELACFFKNE
jgi:hypothetical protein